jgi:ribonucleoside-diphosphate reductase alpha chain
VIESPYDSYGGILKTDQEEAQLMKRRGGVGFDISTIRPKGIHTNNAAKTTDGIAVFMERFSNTCREVAQGGRRRALMLSISVHHPEIETFVNIKRNLEKVTGANISVRVSDEFMKAVRAGETYEVRFPVEAGLDEYLIQKQIDAKDIWNQLIEGAHSAAEPGVLFWDTIKRRSPADIYPNFQTQSTNPCGEIPLCPYDSCRLLAINLFGYVVNPFSSDAHFNWELFKSDVIIAQRYMDDIIDLELEKIDAILAKIKSDPEEELIKLYEINLWEEIKKMTIKYFTNSMSYNIRVIFK